MPESGAATVLLVDDEELLRELMRDALALQGYHVIDAANGVDGLKAVHSHGAGIDLLITDMVMPHLTGTELAAMLRADRPDLRVLFLSGYPDAIDLADPSTVFLEKPFPLAALFAKVRTLLAHA